jgi:hypothetical protein
MPFFFLTFIDYSAHFMLCLAFFSSKGRFEAMIMSLHKLIDRNKKNLYVIKIMFIASFERH